MKKALPIILLILGGVLADFIGIIGCICLLFVIFDISGISCILLLGGHVTGAVFLQRFYQRRWQLGKPLFWICSGFPGAFFGALSYAAVLALDKMGYFTGFFAGLGEYILALAALAYSGAFFVVLGIVLLIVHVVSRRKPKI